MGMGIHHVLITIIVMQITIIQVESTLTSSVAKGRRTQSMRIPPYNSELRPKTPPASPSGSSSSTASRNIESESKPIAGTSSSFQLETEHQHLEPLIEKESKHVRVISSARSIDPMAGTQSEHLDPTRDGVFARMRNRMLRYGSSAVIGYAIGAGGLTAAKQLLFQNSNNITQPVNTTQNRSNQTSYNDIISNPFNDA